MEENLKRVAAYAKRIGLAHFVMVIKSGNIVTFHMEDTKMNDAMTMMISGFHHVIALELERHPEWSPQYRKLYTDLARDFNDLIKASNYRIERFGNKKT